MGEELGCDSPWPRESWNWLESWAAWKTLHFLKTAAQNQGKLTQKKKKRCATTVQGPLPCSSQASEEGGGGVSGSSTTAPHLPRMKNKSTKTWSAWGGKVADLSKEKGPEPSPLCAFIRFIHTRILIKLINHCQAVRVKQYIIYRELSGLILSYGQLVKGL